MSLRPQKGNMYNFVTHCWNPIKGRCPHECAYCYMRRFLLGPLHLDEKELRTNLGTGNFIFVGSGTDMWAEEVPESWIDAVFDHMNRFENTYLLQSKNPGRFLAYESLRTDLTKSCIWGTTIETNRKYPQMGKAPSVLNRVYAMTGITGRKMVTIEPIMDFDVYGLVHLLEFVHPEWVNIGADSKRSGLPEPSREKTLELIAALGEFTAVKIKDNLKRIIGGPDG